jgi:hypothetical protein
VDSSEVPSVSAPKLLVREKIPVDYHFYQKTPGSVLDGELCARGEPAISHAVSTQPLDLRFAASNLNPVSGSVTQSNGRD